MNLKLKVLRATILGTVLGLLALAFTVAVEPYVDSAQAQQGTFTTVPRAGNNFSLAVTGTTTVTVAPIVMLNVSGTTASPVTGTHSVQGWAFYGAAANCFIQVFDVYPAASVTLGSTVPITSIAVFASSALQPYAAPVSLFTLSSSLTIASATTPTGSTACPTSPVGHFFYK